MCHKYAYKEYTNQTNISRSLLFFVPHLVWKGIDKPGVEHDNPQVPYRIIPFVNNHIYHVYNRGNEKRVVFLDQRDYQRFLKTIEYYQYKGPKPKLSTYLRKKKLQSSNSPKIVKILAYCLMPNHFHLMLEQVEDNGLEEVIRKTCLSYAKYFNTRHKRVGSLFQGPFKAVLVESDEQLMHLSRYIHLNPIASLMVKKIEDYQYSSYPEYTNQLAGICNRSTILTLFSSTTKYEHFVLDQVDFSKKLELVKHMTLE